MYKNATSGLWPPLTLLGIWTIDPFTSHRNHRNHRLLRLGLAPVQEDPTRSSLQSAQQQMQTRQTGPSRQKA